MAPIFAPSTVIPPLSLLPPTCRLIVNLFFVETVIPPLSLLPPTCRLNVYSFFVESSMPCCPSLPLHTQLGLPTADQAMRTVVKADNKEGWCSLHPITTTADSQYRHHHCCRPPLPTTAKAGVIIVTIHGQQGWRMTKMEEVRRRWQRAVA